MSTIYISQEVVERLEKGLTQSQEAVRRFGEALVEQGLAEAIGQGLRAGASRAEGLRERWLT